jgi:WD40 repeat protein
MNNLLKLSLLVATGVFSSAVSATEPPITAIAFAPDGESVVTVSQSGLQVLSWPKLDRQRTIKTSASNLHCVAFSPNGKHLAVGGGNPSEDGIAEVFSWPAGEPLTKFDDHDDSVRSVAWHDDTRLLTASIDREIKLWDLEKKVNPVLTFKGHSRSVDAVCLLKDGKILVSAGVDQSVRVWDLESGELILSENQHTKPVHALALRPVEVGLPMVASAAGDRTIRLWQPTIGRMVRFVQLDAEPLDIAWLSDGSRIVASCVDGRIRVVDADEVKVTQTLLAIEGWAYALAIHPTDGSIAVGGSDGQIRRIEILKAE